RLALLSVFFFSVDPLRPNSLLFPYTTLFRSKKAAVLVSVLRLFCAPASATGSDARHQVRLGRAGTLQQVTTHRRHAVAVPSQYANKSHLSLKMILWTLLCSVALS